jgi:cysteine desulfuration protein SufE
MAANIQEIEDEIVAEFELFDDPMDKYEHIIEEGKKLPPIEERFRTDEFLVKGCQSKVWLGARKEGDLLFFEADSNTSITKGIVALLLRVLSGQKPQDILDSNLDFISRTSLRSHLSSQRANGLSSMILKIRNYATLNL